MQSVRTIASWMAGWFCMCHLVSACGGAAERLEVEIPSAASGAPQRIAVIIPEETATDTAVQPLLVSLHTWSADVNQRQVEFEVEAERRGWIYLFPNFQGPNRTPQACGSDVAQRQIVEAVVWCCQNYPVDRRRIYLAGVSGGGHMTLLMAGRYPQLWAAASAWVGISDLTDWHRTHRARGTKYATDLENVFGGPPTDSVERAEAYRARSPLTYLGNAVDLPLDIAAGIHDGHQGSVPIRQSVWAFNAVAQAHGEGVIEEAVWRGWEEARPPETPEDPTQDPRYDDDLQRLVHHRRQVGQARLTLFEGGHEGIGRAAVRFLEQHVRDEPVSLEARALLPHDAPPAHKPSTSSR